MTELKPWCETCGKAVQEVLCPTCAKWWNDNPPPSASGTDEALTFAATALRSCSNEAQRQASRIYKDTSRSDEWAELVAEAEKLRKAADRIEALSRELEALKAPASSDEALVEELARIIAAELGDDYDHAFVSKVGWVAARGEAGGRYRDINEPFQGDYESAARAILPIFQRELAASKAKIEAAEGLAKQMQRIAVFPQFDAGAKQNAMDMQAIDLLETLSARITELEAELAKAERENLEQRRRDYDAGALAMSKRITRNIEKSMNDRFDENGTREPDTNACYYQGAAAEIFESLDEEGERMVEVFSAIDPTTLEGRP